MLYIFYSLQFPLILLHVYRNWEPFYQYVSSIWLDSACLPHFIKIVFEFFTCHDFVSAALLHLNDCEKGMLISLTLHLFHLHIIPKLPTAVQSGTSTISMLQKSYRCRVHFYVIHNYSIDILSQHAISFSVTCPFICPFYRSCLHNCLWRSRHIVKQSKKMRFPLYSATIRPFDARHKLLSFDTRSCLSPVRTKPIPNIDVYTVPSTLFQNIPSDSDPIIRLSPYYCIQN